MVREGRPPEGSWTEHYPELGTGAISFADSTSREFFADEREAVFKRAWLNVARVEELPRVGNYVTKEIEVARCSVILVKGRDEQIRAFYNVCRHRGNKLVWNDFPNEATRGTCRRTSITRWKTGCAPKPRERHGRRSCCGLMSFAARSWATASTSSC